MRTSTPSQTPFQTPTPSLPLATHPIRTHPPHHLQLSLCTCSHEFNHQQRPPPQPHSSMSPPSLPDLINTPLNTACHTSAAFHDASPPLPPPIITLRLFCTCSPAFNHQQKAKTPQLHITNSPWLPLHTHPALPPPPPFLLYAPAVVRSSGQQQGTRCCRYPHPPTYCR